MFKAFGIGRVLVMGFRESFLSKSLITKLKEVDINAVFVHAAIQEIKLYIIETELVVMFMSEDLVENQEALIYLKDNIQERNIGLILIGEPSEYELFIKTIPEQAVTEWFKRPIELDKLFKRINLYLDENTGDMRKKSILIVDDDITYMRTVYEWLKDDYRVGMASNGVQAISYLSKNHADLILLDYEMPVANGPQVLSMLRGESETGQIPVMFLTGHGDRESVLSVLDLKPADYILKTIDRAGLLAKLKDFFVKTGK